ncbi:MAG: CocE/NonD family hydrolase [Lentihominibacter sp.]
MYSTICDPKIMKTLLPQDFPADKLSKPEYKMVVEKNIKVTMRDGVKIDMDIYRPDAPGQFPVIFSSTGYMKETAHLPNIPVFHFAEVNDIEWFVSRGYIFAIQDQRGSGDSVEGIWDLYGEEMQNDLYDCIEWLGVQPWSTGKVGMMGESLLAWAQWFAAAKQPPHLVSIMPFDGGADLYRDVVYHGGTLSQAFPSTWHFIEIRGNYRLAQMHNHPNEQGQWDMQWDILKHPTFDDFWKIRRADMSKIKVPVYSIGVWHKTGLHLRGNTRGYEEIDAPKKLLLIHGDFEGDEMAIYNSPELRMLLLRWLDHWLKGNDTGFMDEPPVTAFIHGLNEYRQENEWPIERAEYTKLYLSPGKSGTVDSLNDGCLSFEEPASETGSVTYSYPNPDWSHFSGIGSAVMENGQTYSYKRVLTFTTEPFEEDLEVLGHARLVVYVSTEQEYPAYKDTKIMLKVWDQLPDDQHDEGYPLKGRLLSHGRLRASHSFEHDEELERPWRPYYTHENPVEIENGKIYKYEVEVYPFGNIFKKGHRLRLELANHDSGPFDFGGHMYGLNIGKDTIYFNKEYPSHLVLPVTNK